MERATSIEDALMPEALARRDIRHLPARMATPTEVGIPSICPNKVT
ncbi:MAG: hypothetical protein IPI87_08360 [Betaproteobacteria bacterium]|nr:hypothetical protein [Betaproteobacteria bacterium]